jgi:hypothetical protein
MSETSEPQGKPGIIRQEGPHRVQVAPGSHSARAPSVGVGSKRLRPAIGAAPLPDAFVEGAEAVATGMRRQVQGGASSTTEIRRIPGRSPVNSRFAPGNESTVASTAAAPSALEKRLTALAELNAQTSKTVTSFEREVSSQNPDTVQPIKPTAAADPAAAGAGHEPGTAIRSLFKRRTK